MSQGKTEWRSELYDNGTALVTVAGPLYGGPYLAVKGLPRKDVGTMADELAQFLNGEKDRPGWLDDMERRDEQTAVGVDGSEVRAEGPMLAAPDGSFSEDGSQQSRDDRARLLDRLKIDAYKPRRRRR